MSEQPTQSGRSAKAEAGAFGAIPELGACDYLYSLNLDFNIEAQLIAVRGLLDRNRQGAAELTGQIKQIEEHARGVSGVQADWALDNWLNHIHHSAYQEAAHSMSAVGMLAPLVETIFYQCFQRIGDRFYPASQPTKCHDRWKAARVIQWDCHNFIIGNRSKKNLVRGIFQLSEAVGLTSKLPAELKRTLSALFAYRNNMFHLGFEWPREDRERFAKRITDEGWPNDWFNGATSGSNPWIFYMSDSFIEHCLTTTDSVFDAIGVFVRDELLPKQPAS